MNTPTEMTTATFRIEKGMKEKAQKLYKSLGLDFSTAMNIFIYKSVRENGIPFELRNEEPNEVTYQAMDDAENDRNMVGPFNSVDEMMEYLNADD